MAVTGFTYDWQSKRLVVQFDNGETRVYKNVDPPAADAMSASPSWTFHWQKYINPVYMSEERRA